MFFEAAPSQIRSLVGEENKTIALSLVVLMTALVTLIVSPFIGLWSDHFISPYGKRRPFMVAGAFLTAAGLILQGMAAPNLPALITMPELCNASNSTFNTTLTSTTWASSPISTTHYPVPMEAATPAAIWSWRFVWFLGAHFLIAIGLLTIEIPFNGLVADVVSPDQRGAVSSFIGIGAIGGAIAGSVIGIFYRELHVMGSFSLVASLLLVAVFIGCGLRELPTARVYAEDFALQPVAKGRKKKRVAPGAAFKSVLDDDDVKITTSAPPSAWQLMWQPFKQSNFCWLFFARFLAMMGIQTM
jgi:MFS family permease